MPQCAHCQETFELSPQARRLLEKFPDEPEPRTCFRCGQKHRLLFRNGTKLYRRTCDATGARIISSIAQEKPYVVYSQEAWWSDTWDAQSYGQPIDWNRPFFEQFRDLQQRVPRIALTNINAENSEYCNMSDGNKNCYLIFGGDYNEDAMYGIFGMKNRSVMDCDMSNYNERCYWMCDSFHCYDCRYTIDSQNCSSCAYVSDCTGCTDCILCTNLVKKSYCIRNVQLSKEEYVREKEQLLQPLHSVHEALLQEFAAMRARRLVRSSSIVASEACTGEYIQSSHRCENCYDTWDSEDLSDVILGFNAKDSLSSGCIGGTHSTLCYDTQSAISAYNTRHSYAAFESSDIEYCDFVLHCSSLFGCVGMRRASHCILNRQYSPEEFAVVRARLVRHMQQTGEWGQFFPASCSCFSYNESTASMYFPLSEDQARAEGYSWFTASTLPLDVQHSIDAADLPDSIDDVSDDILQCALRCSSTGMLYKILRPELAMYHSMRLPVPRLHPEERMRRRMADRRSVGLFSRSCLSCGAAIDTTFTPDRPENVVCEACYRKEVY